jgi:hypothetical protein
MMAIDSTQVTGCPRGEVRELAADYLAGHLSAAQAKRFEAHVIACPTCWQEVERALELRAAFQGSSAQVRPLGPRHGSGGAALEHGPRRRWLGARELALAAAALVAGLGLAHWVSLPTSPPPRVVRGEDSIPLQVHVAAAGRIEISWPAVADADLYLFRLFTGDGELLLERTLAEPGLVLEPDLLALPAGEPLFARVEALDGLRRRRAVSRLEPLPAPLNSGEEGTTGRSRAPP